MKSRNWKIAVVVISLLIIFTYGWTTTFHSISRTYLVHGYGSNGTAILILAENDVNVNGRIDITPTSTYPNPSPVKVTLWNGTVLTSDSTITIEFHFNGNIFTGQSTTTGGIANVSISSSSPLVSAKIQNLSLNDFMHVVGPGSEPYGSNVNYYSVFIQNYAIVSVSMVGGGL